MDTGDKRGVGDDPPAFEQVSVVLDAVFIRRKGLRVADIHREDDQVDCRVEDQDAAEHQDQHADGVPARRQFQPRAAVSHDALSDDIRHVLSRRLVCSIGGRLSKRFFADSPVVGTGFEPSVPRQEKWSMPSSSDQTRVGRTLTLGGGAESSLEGRDIELSVSPKDIRTSPYDLCANRSDRRQSREGDRWFESTSLHGESSVRTGDIGNGT